MQQSGLRFSLNGAENTRERAKMTLGIPSEAVDAQGSPVWRSTPR
jgi:hypothetical protein